LAGGLNLYAYVGNNPINGIDPLGLVVFYVPGTWSNGTADTFPTSFVNAVQKHFDDPNARFFNWSGADNDAARQSAAFALAEQIRAYKKKHPCEPIRVVAHSHGGNVALLTSQKPGVEIDELVTLGTPIMPAYRPGAGLDAWVNISSTGDQVQDHPLPTLSADRTDPAAFNIVLSGFGHSELHTVTAWNAAFQGPTP
jgi:pimeloyl-ACP methyl ester carboxylesterase